MVSHPAINSRHPNAAHFSFSLWFILAIYKPVVQVSLSTAVARPCCRPGCLRAATPCWAISLRTSAGKASARARPPLLPPACLLSSMKTASASLVASRATCRAFAHHVRWPLLSVRSDHSALRVLSVIIAPLLTILAHCVSMSLESKLILYPRLSGA